MGAREGHCGMQTTCNLVSKMILKQGGLTYGIMADGVPCATMVDGASLEVDHCVTQATW